MPPTDHIIHNLYYVIPSLDCALFTTTIVLDDPTADDTHVLGVEVRRMAINIILSHSIPFHFDLFLVFGFASLQSPGRTPLATD